MIPFIDVMLVLVIIFMIAAPISTVDIEVDMPTSKIDPSRRPPKPTWVSITEDATGLRVFVMNDEVPMEGLGEAAYEAVKTNDPRIANDDFEVKDQRIYIRADGTTAYRNVVRVMNQLQNRGFTKIGFVAEDRRS
ncbi:biopolymer transport protein ExbD/tolR [alpha proteobacterium U9-1i]|nr:biopolymer transport protein ExbD/tolR [alpha proteobacterium U9-1i]